MKRILGVALALAFAWVAAAQTQTTQQTTETKTVTVSGEVVRYEPGQVIVIREPDRREVTFTIGPAAAIPAEIQIGRQVTLTTEPAADGSGPAVVTKITTTTVNAEGQLQTKTERTETSPSGQTKTVTTEVYGKVTGYEPGRTITIERPDQQPLMLTLDKESQLPADVAVGKVVTVKTITVAGKPIVRVMTYRKVTEKKTQ
jgi:hypothetical protein